MLTFLRRHPLRASALALAGAFLLLNVVAYRHAWSMTHFVPGGGVWKGRPENLSLAQKAGAVLGGVSLCRPSCDAAPPDDCEVHRFSGPAGPLEGWYLPRDRSRGLVLLFHGYARCKGTLLPEAGAFRRLGFACFLVDFRGCGGSAGDCTTIGHAEADDVARAVEYARAAWPGRHLVLFGQSMGSVAVLRALGARGVRADAAVLECPFDRLLTTVKMRFEAMGLPAFPAAHLLVFWGGLQHGFNGFAHNPVEDARGVRCPVLLLHGEDDPRVRPAHVQAIAAGLAGPHAVHAFAGVGHESCVARVPGEWERVVAAFLAKSGPAYVPEVAGR